VLTVGLAACTATEPSELDIQSKITEAGCLALMSKGLDVHPHARRLYTEVCRLAALLCFDTVAVPHGTLHLSCCASSELTVVLFAADNQADIANAGIFAAICERLDSTDISEEEAVAGCIAIAALAYENGACCLAIVTDYR
jgi:hypothetical protein